MLSILLVFSLLLAPKLCLEDGNRLEDVWKGVVAKSSVRPHCESCISLRRYIDDIISEKEIKSIRIETLKQTILKKLGLTEPPKFSTPSEPLPVPFEDGRLSLEKDLPQPLTPVTKRFIMLFSDYEWAQVDDGCSMNMRLEIPVALQGKEISGAIMWIYMKHEDLKSCLMFATPCDAEGTIQVVPTFFHSFKDGWSESDITETLNSWLELGSLCHKIELTCELPTCEDPMISHPSRKPFIFVDIAPDEHEIIREKKSLNCVSNTKECCRESLHVSFKDIGWDDWIIQPTDYNAYYCKGTCAYPTTLSLSNAPYHTVVRKYNLLPDRHTDVNSCCTPARLSPLQIIYKNHNNTYLQRIVQDLTVESCKCM